MILKRKKPDFYMVIEHTTFSKLDVMKPTDRQKLDEMAESLKRNLVALERTDPLAVNDKTARLNKQVRHRVVLDPKDRNFSFRLCLPYNGDDLSYREQLALSHQFHDRVLTIIEDKKLLQDLQIKTVGLAATRARTLMAGHASPEEIMEQSAPKPGDKVERHNPTMEDQHPNGVVDRVDGDLVHCFDENEDDFSFRQLPI